MDKPYPMPEYPKEITKKTIRLKDDELPPVLMPGEYLTKQNNKWYLVKKIMEGE